MIPQDEDPVPKEPLKKNSPPRIITGLNSPESPTTVALGDNCPPISNFYVYVDDPDREDRIRHKWFVDDPTFKGLSFPGAQLGPVSADGGTIRKVVPPAAVFSMSSCWRS